MTRVHFIHGLEGHGRGSKVLGMEAQGFDVSAPEMSMSLWGLRRTNSMARNLMRLPETRALAVLSLAGVAHGVWRGSGPRVLAAVLLPAGWFALRRRALASAALGRSYEACMQIQRDALRNAPPEVLVGSSWGGSIAVDLMREGTWSGPTILLAPAWARVRARTGRSSGGDVFDPAGRVVLFHDPEDDTVPVMDSVRLTAGTDIEAHFVSAGGHRLMGLLESGRLAETIHRLAAQGGC